MKHFASTVHSCSKLLLTLLLTVFATGLYAQLGTLSVQGVLTKADGTAVDDGTYSIEFSLWKSESSTNTADRVHVETISTQTTGGVYSVILGLGTPFGGAATFAEVYYLGVKFGSTELLPRPRLTSAPYALALLGSTNVFPGTGMVTCDAITVAGSVNISSATASGALGANHFVAAGGAPNAGVAGKGYSFNNAGDPDGGLFSLGDNNVALYANATKALEANGGGVLIPGVLQVNNGQTVNNGQNVNGPQTVTGNSTVTGYAQCNARFLTNFVGASPSGGYSFINDGGYDSGLFGTGDGVCGIYANGAQRFMANLGINSIYGTTEINLQGGFLYINGVKPKGTTGNPRNIAIDMDNGRIFEESSSRRYKINIRPLQEDFSLLLKVEPRIYNRYEDPIDIDTSKIYEIGYIAEEIDSIGLHKLVQYNNEGQIDGVDYTKMILYAVEVLKMQDVALSQLRADLNALRTENDTLRTENNSLRTTNTTLQGQQEAFGKQLDAISRRMQLLETTAGNR